MSETTSYWWDDPSWEEYAASCPLLHHCDVCGVSGLWTPLHQAGDLWLCEGCEEER